MALEAREGLVDLVDQEAPVAMVGQEGQMDLDNGTTTDLEGREDREDREAREVQEDPVAQDTPKAAQGAQEDPDSLIPEAQEAREIHTDHPMVEEYGTTTFGQSKARRTCFPVCLPSGTTVSSKLGPFIRGSKSSSTTQ